ncbi:DNA repair protein RecO [Tenacibaculum sediminilitoris]|uniref:DNA repair protein RecO n=1 Tax=Tenacibaculum sediminilitoris TaxID=1820334 RepID=UPI003893CA06
MAIVTTKAIVLSALKYGDTSLIVKCFTLQEGLKSYMIKGVLKAKKGKLKPAYFQPLTQLNLTGNHSNKNSLHSIKEVQVIHPYETIYTSVVKQTIVLFLSEVLSHILQEEEENIALYSYIETSLIWLDTHNEVANFHLLFLLNLTRYLGFYPDTSNIDKQVFNLLEGRFTNTEYKKLTLSGREIILFKNLLGINFDAINSISYSKKERQIILRIIVQYYELHLEGFKKPKSLDVLETVFN